MEDILDTYVTENIREDTLDRLEGQGMDYVIRIFTLCESCCQGIDPRDQVYAKLSSLESAYSDVFAFEWNPDEGIVDPLPLIPPPERTQFSLHIGVKRTNTAGGSSQTQSGVSEHMISGPPEFTLNPGPGSSQTQSGVDERIISGPPVFLTMIPDHDQHQIQFILSDEGDALIDEDSVEFWPGIDDLDHAKRVLADHHDRKESYRGILHNKAVRCRAMRRRMIEFLRNPDYDFGAKSDEDIAEENSLHRLKLIELHMDSSPFVINWSDGHGLIPPGFLYSPSSFTGSTGG